MAGQNPFYPYPDLPSWLGAKIGPATGDVGASDSAWWKVPAAIGVGIAQKWGRRFPTGGGATMAAKAAGGDFSHPWDDPRAFQKQLLRGSLNEAGQQRVDDALKTVDQFDPYAIFEDADALKSVKRDLGDVASSSWNWLTGQSQSPNQRVSQAFGSLPGYAEGGRPDVGQPAMVGENGPEMFVPDQPGTVVPHWLLSALGHAPPAPQTTNSMLDPSLMPLFMQSGMTQAPPAAPPPPSWLQSAAVGPVAEHATFASEMDPFERSAYTMRRHYGTQVPGPPDLATPGEQLQAASMLVPGTGVARAIGAAPKLATGLGAGLAWLYGTDQAGGAEVDQVKQMQTHLKELGYYGGKIDGNMGPETQKAKAAFDAAEALRQQNELAAQTANANAETAKAQKAAADAALAATQARQQGNERLQQVEGQVSPVSRAIRDYAGPLGWLLGGAIGSGTRAGVVKGYNYLSQRAADRAEGVMASRAADFPARVERANEFWRQGGAGAGAVPFTNVPSAPGVAANPNAAALGDLFQPNRLRSVGTDLGIMGTMGGEYALSQHLLGGAQQELRDAQAAMNAEPSEVNIQRLQSARDRVAAYEGMGNIGRGGALGYGAGMLKWGRNPATPDMRRAGAERLRLEDILREPAPSALPTSPMPAFPTPAGPAGLPPGPAPLALPAPSRRPIFDQSLGGGRGGWRDPITGNITRAPRTP